MKDQAFTLRAMMDYKDQRSRLRSESLNLSSSGAWVVPEWFEGVEGVLLNVGRQLSERQALELEFGREAMGWIKTWPGDWIHHAHHSVIQITDRFRIKLCFHDRIQPGLTGASETVSSFAKIRVLDLSDVAELNINQLSMFILGENRGGLRATHDKILELYKQNPQKYEIALAVNSVTSGKEGLAVFQELSIMLAQVSDIRLSYLGHIEEFSRITKSIRKQKFLIELYPGAPVCACLELLSKHYLAWSRQSDIAEIETHCDLME